MALKIKGLDQITAWAAGIFGALGLLTIFWYGSQYYVNRAEEKKQADMQSVLHDLDSLKNKKKLEHSHHTQDDAHKTHLRQNPAPATFHHYGYTGNLAPWYWANLNESWRLCESGSSQSPIDLSGARLDDRLKSLKFFYRHGVTSFSLSNQTVTGRIERGSYLEWDGERFDLSQVMFRTPSEHHVNSLPFEMELQLEHVALDGRKIMVSVLLTPGIHQSLLERVSKNIPGGGMQDIQDIEQLKWDEVFPPKKTYWTYLGSATTPPCQEGVRWVVFTHEVATSKASIDRFVLKQKSNARPIFKIGKRAVTRSNR